MFSITKVFALVMIIIAGAIHLIKGNAYNLSWDNMVADTTASPGKIALSFYSGLFSFAGWNYLNFVTEELQEPNKNLPRAIYISLPLVTIIYLLANVSYFAVLTSTEILSSSAVAVTFGNKLFGVMRWIIPFFVACSTFGAVNSGIVTMLHCEILCEQFDASCRNLCQLQTILCWSQGRSHAPESGSGQHQASHSHLLSHPPWCDHSAPSHYLRCLHPHQLHLLC